jgi:uncharacterized protein
VNSVNNSFSADSALVAPRPLSNRYVFMKSVIKYILVFTIFQGANMAGNLPEGAISAPDVVYWASLGRIEQVKKALDKGADPNSTDGGGYSALQAAAENNYLEIVKLLVSKGANINYKGTYSALELATMSGNVEIIEYLKAHGAQ